MTVATLDFATASVQPFQKPSYEILVTRPSDAPRETSTLLDESYDDGWKISLLYDLIERAATNEFFEVSTLRSFMEWLSVLPNDLPRPFFTVAEDGSLVVEWDIRGMHLHVTFDQEASEAYFLGPAEEWEETAHTDKMSNAMRAILAAIHE